MDVHFFINLCFLLYHPDDHYTHLVKHANKSFQCRWPSRVDVLFDLVSSSSSSSSSLIPKLVYLWC